MLKVTFFKKNGVYFGFKETGHAGFDDEGFDIVCSAVSAMTMLVVNAIEVSYCSEAEYNIINDSADIEVYAYGALPETGLSPEKQFAISGLIYAYYVQLIDLIEEYGDYISVEERELSK